MHHIVEYDISLVKNGFGLMTFAVFVASILVYVFDKHLPRIFVDTYKYGKYTNKNPSPLIVMVPKSWFRHFYVVGVICTGLVMAIMIKACVFDYRPPIFLITFLDAVASNKRISSGADICTVIGITLLFAHCVSRLAETYFISVYSPSYINIAHYACGIAHYIGAAVAIAAESPVFSNVPGQCSLSLDELTVFECFGVVIFCMASYEQLKSSIILANLRKNKIGRVYTYKHLIPSGRFFEVLSAPHIVAEIVIYVALTCILRRNQTWWFVFVWVLINQCAVSWMSHKWYQENFPTYPKKRKALIPYLF